MPIIYVHKGTLPFKGPFFEPGGKCTRIFSTNISLHLKGPKQEKLYNRNLILRKMTWEVSPNVVFCEKPQLYWGFLWL